MSLLDTVEPVGWLNPNPRHPEDWFSLFEQEGWSPLYSRETVESLLAECRKQVRAEAFIEAAERFESMEWVQSVDPNENYAEATELRRMAEGEK